MSTNLPPMPMPSIECSAPSYTTNRVKTASVKNKTTETSANSTELTSEMFLNPVEELSNPEGYLYYSRF